MIYFVLCREASAVKIGHTQTRGIAHILHKRVSMLQSGCPLRLELICVREGCLEEEREIHARFAGSQIHGEWFRLTGELQKYMDGCEVPPPDTGTSALRRKWMVPA